MTQAVHATGTGQHGTATGTASHSKAVAVGNCGERKRGDDCKQRGDGDYPPGALAGRLLLAWRRSALV